MTADVENETYPGESASPWQILDLALQYDRAFVTLSLALRDVPEHLSPSAFAPARFCAIHAIELFLNAVLRFEGVSPAQIRGRMHTLSDPLFLQTLGLRAKTAAHLAQLTEHREYLVARYDARRMHPTSELNRLTATLTEVATKANAHLNTSTYLEWRTKETG